LWGWRDALGTVNGLVLSFPDDAVSASIRGIRVNLRLNFSALTCAEAVQVRVTSAMALLGDL
jgi:hypothetical protein